MEEVVINELTHGGLRRVRVIADAAISEKQYQAAVPCEARDRAKLMPASDDLLGLFSLEITWPVYGPVEFSICGPKKFRRLMVVNFVYAERVSEVIAMAGNEYFARTHFVGRDAYVKELPTGAEVGMLVHGLVLQVAEWMPAECVAVGGRDG
jgi:hypothetical protein